MSQQRVLMVILVLNGAIPTILRKTLEKDCVRLYQHHFGKHHKLFPIWVEVPRSQAFLAAEPSNATTVSIGVEDDLPNDIRHAFMSEFCKLWMTHTGCNKNEFMLTAMDFQAQRDLLALTQTRIRPSRRLLATLQMVGRLAKSKIFSRHFSASINL
ncbi:hypothetical protein [Endozoicomonas sp. 4G]|uniref:hypothetical protein n=1 Tax=Endozoicomonas sp. 4G TaxID=2872754 RepID=UPI002078CE11|nr:hypothetical protein [Endozoicomonas sp. 4G]